VAGSDAEMLPVSLNCPLPLQRTHPPTLVCCFCVFAALGVTSTKSGATGSKSVLNLGSGVGRAIWELFYFQLFQNLEILHGHPFVAAYVFGDNA